MTGLPSFMTGSTVSNFTVVPPWSSGSTYSVFPATQAARDFTTFVAPSESMTA